MEQLQFEIYPNGVPNLTYQEIDDYAVHLLRDFQPESLKGASFFDIKGFVRRYLGCRLSCHSLSRDESVEAAIFFADTFPYFFDDGLEIRLHVTPGTIVIDPFMLCRPNACRVRTAHEAGHYLLHSDYFKRLGMFEEEVHPRFPKTAIKLQVYEALEKQANQFADCVLMNRPALLAYWDELKPTLIERFGNRTHTAETYAIAAVAGAFEVTRTASLRRLAALGLIYPNQQYLAPRYRPIPPNTYSVYNDPEAFP